MSLAINIPRLSQYCIYPGDSRYAQERICVQCLSGIDLISKKDSIGLA